MLEEAWAALGGEPGAPLGVVVQNGGPHLGSALAVDELAQATVACALLAAAELAEARGGPRVPVSLDGAHVAAAFTSERHLRLDGASLGAPFSPESAFMAAADGWVRLHGNYPHHAAALRSALGLPSGAAAGAIRAAVAERPAVAVEEAVIAAGGCAAAVRGEPEWRAHPQGAALEGLGLLDVAPGEAGARPLPPLAPGALPAAGLRVLDLSRVIAGPVATRTLAALGAEVLRIDPPQLPELPLGALDTGPGKRSALLDLRDPDDRRALDGLLGEADVLVQGYRPGALEALGLDASRHPSLTTVTLSAWGHTGRWSDRRGFDSLVQAATGIAARLRTDDAPGALPAQALDHGTGHLIAAAALRGLAHRAREGRLVHPRFALARTAGWLLGRPRGPASPATIDPGPFLETLDSPSGAVTLVAPPGRLGDRPLRWPHGPPAHGADALRWG